jgi:hypothetical protein
MHERDSAQVLADVHVTSDASPGNWEQGRARATVTRHATYIVAAHVSGAARYQEHHLEKLRPTTVGRSWLRSPIPKTRG